MRGRLLLIALLLFPAAARGGNDMGLAVGPVEAVGGAICVSWRVENPFTPRLRETLDQGMPARVIYEVGVWKKRTFWFDKLVVAIRSEHKVVYDALKGRYRLRSGTGPPRESAVASFDSLSARLFTQSRLPLVLASELDSTATYYVSVRTTIRPLSPEDLAEVEGWLAGGRSDGVRGIPEYLMALAVSLSGLGDRSALEKSERWKPARLLADAGAMGRYREAPATLHLMWHEVLGRAVLAAPSGHFLGRSVSLTPARKLRNPEVRSDATGSPRVILCESTPGGTIRAARSAVLPLCL